jgi:antirestriction protein ArdC
MKNPTYDRITDRITALLEQGTVPWQKPWKARTGLPRNFVSKNPIVTFIQNCSRSRAP